MKLTELLTLVNSQVALVPEGKTEITAAEAITLFQLKQNVTALTGTVKYIQDSVKEMGRASETIKQLKQGDPEKVIEKISDLIDYVAAVALLHENVYEVPK